MDVIVSDWHAAPFALDGETVFAVGDVHGCAGQMERLLGAIGETAATVGGSTRLVYLGDLIDRGPRNLDVLNLWAEPASTRGVDRVDRLMGNHEQLLLLAVGDGPHAPKAATMWLSEKMGGEAVLAELCRAASRSDPLPSAGLFRAALGDDVFRLFSAMGSHVTVGNGIKDARYDEWLSPADWI